MVHNTPLAVHPGRVSALVFFPMLSRTVLCDSDAQNLAYNIHLAEKEKKYQTL